MSVQLMHGDCLTLMRSLPDRSIDLIATDPPFYKVKGDAWDNQWETPVAFLAWFDLLAEQWQRILKPNGSLYVFAWPRMSARIEVLLAERFNVLQRITWAKPPYSTKAEMNSKEEQRSYFPVSESILFAEHIDADNVRAEIFAPLRCYIEAERLRAGVDKVACNVACGFKASAGGMAARHYFSASQWCLPTEPHYLALQGLFGPGFLARGYASVRQEYEHLMAIYLATRRHFNVTADMPYTDVWTFPTVATRSGKHPCEKPLPMMEHIITASSREGGVVLDPFMGSGVTGEAAVRLGRKFIGMEVDAGHFASASRRVHAARLRSSEEVALRRVLAGVEPSDQPEEFI